jgi:hypothetical protein
MKSLNHIHQRFNLPRQRLQPPQLPLRQNPPRSQLTHRKPHTNLQIVNSNQKRLIKNLTLPLLRSNTITNQTQPRPKSNQTVSDQRQTATDKPERNLPIHKLTYKLLFSTCI